MRTIFKHLDLSYNQMKKATGEKLGMLIFDNHTLFGIHMEGNEGYVDKFGYIQVDNQINGFEQSKHTIIYPRSKNGFSKTVRFSKKNKALHTPKVNCWVGEGWKETTFEFKLGDSYHEIEEPVHIHFEYNYFKPELMKCQDDGVYTITTMCPPGKIKYFFTLDKIAVQAKDHLKTLEKTTNPVYIKGIEMYDEIKDYKIKRFNYKLIEQSEVLNDGYMSQLKEGMPRLRQLRYRKQVQYRVKEQWKVQKSVFADYIPDGQTLMDKLFEFDWAMIQKPKFEGDEEEKLKSILKKSYWTIRDAFKYYSSISSSTGSMTFALTLNSYTDYLKQAGVYKGKTITFTDTDTLFFTTNKRDKPSNLNPGNALIRYQFLEIILRLALKFDKKKLIEESVKNFCETIVEQSLKKGKSQDWRMDRYWNEHGDNVFRFHMHLLKEVYSNYSGAVSKPGEEKFMSPGEFERIFVNSNLINQRFANRDIYIGFNLAMQSRVDELTSDAHLKMTFIEFMEALARAADYLSLAPPSDKAREAYLIELHAQDMPKEEKEEIDNDEQLAEEGEEENLEEAEGADMTDNEHTSQPLHK